MKCGLAPSNVAGSLGARAGLFEAGEVRVHPTGKVTVFKVCEAFDCGKAINPVMVNHQIIGGFMQGLATALYEDMRFDEKGTVKSYSFTSGFPEDMARLK